MRCEPLGDQAFLTTWDDEAASLAFAALVRAQAWPWLVDVVQAYRTVAVFYEPLHDDYAALMAALERLAATLEVTAFPTGADHHIPCCYELGPDLEQVARHTGLSTDVVMRLHADHWYTVYAIGFCPGFPYLGYLPTALAGVPRLDAPRLHVEAGSVGLTGRQTGIYTEARPGGWNIVGRTPLLLVDVADGYFPLRTGDRVRFEPIGAAEFERLQGQRL